MEVIEQYQRIFLETLRQSPAWNDLIKAILSTVTDASDDVIFLMSGLPENFKLQPQHIGQTSTDIVPGDEYVLNLDSTCIIQSYDCEFSYDGLVWSNSVECVPNLKIRTSKTSTEDINIHVEQFYPDSVESSSLWKNQDPFGINRDLKSTQFFDKSVATSLFQVNRILGKSKIKYDLQYIYFYDGSEVYGQNDYDVAKAIDLIRLDSNKYYYVSRIPLCERYLVAGKSIESYSDNIIILSQDIPSGTYSVRVIDNLVPNHQGVLQSKLQILMETSDILAKSFTGRVTPYRCSGGYKGNVDLYINSELNLVESVFAPNLTIRSELLLEEVLDIVMNFKVKATTDTIIDKGRILMDYPSTKYYSDKIILV